MLVAASLRFGAVHDDGSVVEERISREVFKRVLPLVHPQRWPLAVEAGDSPGCGAPFTVGSPWGRPWSTTWFRLTGTVPESWGAARVDAVVDLGFDLDSPGFQCEGLVRNRDGRPVQGLHPRRTAVPVRAAGAPDPTAVELLVEAVAIPTLPQFQPSALGRKATSGDRPLYVLRRADLVRVDPEAEALLADFDVLAGVMRTFDRRDQRRSRLRRTIARALDAVAAGDLGSARAVLAGALAQGATTATHRVVATGHAHIDCAWLWPLAEARRKCVRTFSSVLGLLDADPAFRFACSQAQQYEWVREAEPELFERIRGHVAGGQWVPVGGMWVESDMNLPAGESIVRQIVHGQRYFEEHFGSRCTEVWIPDVFGYPAGLPQVFAAGGMRRFVTQKLSWNRTNRFPHHTFWWEGLDGTRVLTHFPPVDTYNAELAPAELAGAVARFAEHAWSDWSLVPFGYGDGGGGPTKEMLDRAHRMADLDGVPRVRLGTPAELFDAVEAEAARGAPVPVWRGELYFEAHRGTLTSQLRTKDANRRCERLLREAELLDVITAGDPTADPAADPAADPSALDDLWRAVLTQQFHDILPGSSIGWVHDDAEAALAGVASTLDRRIVAVVRAVAGPTGAVVNPATWARREVVVGAAVPPGPGPRQALAGGRWAYVVDAPALGLAPLAAAALADAGPDSRSASAVVVTDRSMANGLVALAWDPAGDLASVIDVIRGRELLSGPGAVLTLAPDRPVQYDAWDLESWTVAGGVALGPAERVEVEAAGPLIGVVAVHRSFGDSTTVVRYVLRADSPRLDVAIELDWHHQEHLLSMVFPLDVRADAASCGVQFGHARRPTHPSTSWDAAKFEVCAHRYVDLAEPSFGVAVLDDGRYGHGLFGGAVRVSLARGARYPDPDADQGRHAVTLALLPHGPGLAEVVVEAERLARPLRVVPGSGVGPAVAPALPPPPLTVTGVGVEVDALKRADDGGGDVIVRLHEAVGDRAPVTVGASRRIVAASACNLLEEPERAFEVSDGIVATTLRPFQLVTLRLTLAPPES